MMCINYFTSILPLLMSLEIISIMMPFFFFPCVKLAMTTENDSKKPNYYFGQTHGLPTHCLHLPSPFLKGS